jgi:acetyltransferase
VVNPMHREIDGIPTLRDLSELSTAPDLAIISVPAQTVPDVVAKSAQMGVEAAIIITAGLGHGPARSPMPAKRQLAPRAYASSDQTASGL